MSDAIRSAIAWIAADWGSSNLRAWAMDADDRVLAEVQSDAGMLSLTPNEYELALLRLIGKWLPEKGQTQVVVCGMAGARQGWKEAPYLTAPASLAELANGAVAPLISCPQLRVSLLPGVRQLAREGATFDVMRGEETQLAGLVASTPGFSGRVCLPGTHSKWATLRDGALVSFTTFLSGELYRMLGEHSVLKHSVASALNAADLTQDAHRDAFVTAVKEMSHTPHAFTSKLFGLRAQDLLDTEMPTNPERGALLAARLSGLVIGLELAGIKVLSEPVTLIGSQALCQRYALALETLGQPSQSIEGEEAVLGGLALAHRALAESPDAAISSNDGVRS